MDRNFTEGQAALLDYLLDSLQFEKINYEEKNFTYQFINYLQKSAPKYKHIGNCTKKEIFYNGERKFIPKNGLTTMAYKENSTGFEALGLSFFQLLQIEIQIRKRNLYSKISGHNNYISATDISNFTFCPANFSISKSLYYRSLESAEKGREFHEQSPIDKILRKSSKSGKTEAFPDSELDDEESYQAFKKLISNCEILYSGHSKDKEAKSFKSFKGKFIGQPDYILLDKTEGKIFVVEEKYHQIPREFSSYGNDPYYEQLEVKVRKERNRQVFHLNHINQVLSYVLGIKDYEIHFGVLVYWKYEFDDFGDKIISKCDYKIIRPNKKHKEKLNNLYLQIKEFKQKGEISFDISERNPKKCANCVNNYLCGHKTGKFNTVTYPYNENFLQIKPADFPKQFKRVTDRKTKSYEEKLLERLDEVKQFWDRPNEDPLTI